MSLLDLIFSNYRHHDGLCSSIGGYRKTIYHFVSTVFTIIFYIFSCGSVFIVNLLTVLCLNQETGTRIRTQKEKVTPIATIVLGCLTNVICWITCCIFLIITLSSTTYSMLLFTWAITVVLPLPSIFYPFVLLKGHLKNFDCKRLVPRGGQLSATNQHNSGLLRPTHSVTSTYDIANHHISSS